MLVVEFLTFGNLKDYLKDKRAESRAEKEYMSQDDVTADVIGPRDLIFFAYQAAKGMGHIANHSVSIELDLIVVLFMLRQLGETSKFSTVG